MNAIAWVSLAASGASSLLGLFVYFLNRKASLNRLLAKAFLINGYLAFVGFMMLHAQTDEVAYFWSKMYSVWPFLIASILHFTLLFTQNGLLKKKSAYLLLYAPAAVFSLIDLTTNFISVPPVQTYWGYEYTTAQGSWLFISSIAWFALLGILSFLLFVRFYYRVSDATKRKQVKFTLFGVAVPIVLAICINSIFPALHVDLPRVGHIASSVFSIFIVYAIWRYELLSLSPAMAAESIISAMPDSLVLADLEGKITLVNSSIVKFLGYREKELIGNSINTLGADEKCFEHVRKELLEKREISNFETKCKTKVGEEKPVVISGSVVRSKRGQDIGITFIVHDITERKLIEEKLVRSERFASIGELAGMIGHDLRNPLTSIRAATYYFKVKYGGELDDEGKEIFGTIDRSIDYSNKIVDDLLDYSREIKLKLEIATPKSLLENIFSLVQKPPNVTVVDLTEDAPVVKVDVGKMNRVFVNVVKNAFDVMPNGGTLTIKSQAAEGNLEMRFSDTGIGMSKETLDKLWIPLFTTKAKGMGFGLSICKRIVEAHGGTISVESTFGKGTTFIVTIPAAATAISTEIAETVLI